MLLMSQERIVMIYTIMNGGLFDVGCYIAIEIEKLAKGTRGGTQGSAWFPSIITQLCRRAGIPMGSEEGFCQTKGVMDRSLILTISASTFPDAQSRNVRPPCCGHDWRLVEREQDWGECRDTVNYVHREFFAIHKTVRGA